MRITMRHIVITDSLANWLYRSNQKQYFLKSKAKKIQYSMVHVVGKKSNYKFDLFIFAEK